MRKKYVLTLMAAIVIFCISAALVFITGDATVYSENGLLEKLQVGALIIAWALCLWALCSKRLSDPFLLAFFGLFLTIFILREIDVERLNLPELLIFLGSGSGRNILFGGLMLGSMAYLLWRFKYYVMRARTLLDAETLVLIGLTVSFLLVGAYFEETVFQHHVYFEELLELMAYLTLLPFTVLLTEKLRR